MCQEHNREDARTHDIILERESSLEASEAPSKPPLQLHWDLPFEHQSFALDLLSLLCAPLHKPSYSLQPMVPVPHSQSASLKNT